MGLEPISNILETFVLPIKLLYFLKLGRDGIRTHEIFRL